MFNALRCLLAVCRSLLVVHIVLWRRSRRGASVLLALHREHVSLLARHTGGGQARPACGRFAQAHGVVAALHLTGERSGRQVAPRAEDCPPLTFARRTHISFSVSLFSVALR